MSSLRRDLRCTIGNSNLPRNTWSSMIVSESGRPPRIKSGGRAGFFPDHVPNKARRVPVIESSGDGDMDASADMLSCVAPHRRPRRPRRSPRVRGVDASQRSCYSTCGLNTVCMDIPHVEGVEGVFAALADTTRRTIVERLLAEGELSVGDVASRFPVSTQAISRHLQVLERAGLIERRVDRQWRYVRIRARALEPVESWLSQQRRYWTTALDRLETAAAAQTPKRKKS